MKPDLTIDALKESARNFCKIESAHKDGYLYGVIDGKAVGTYIEHKFQSYLEESYQYIKCSSAKGIDLPGERIYTDIKVTSIRQPQSSCPLGMQNRKFLGWDTTC